MAKKLNTFVTVHRRDDKGQPTGESRTVGPDDDLSTEENSWIEAAITNPDVWDDDGTAEGSTSTQAEDAEGSTPPDTDSAARRPAGRRGKATPTE